MSIERVYTRNVVGAGRSTSLQQTALLMREHHVGTLLVTEDEPNENKAIGIVTDRDLVVHAMAEGIMPDEMSVQDVMTPGLASVSAKADLHEALETMRTGGLRRLLVAGDDGEIAGIISLDDIVDALAADLSSLAGVIRSERERESAEND
jgi:CBS domain-containing protein